MTHPLLQFPGLPGPSTWHALGLGWKVVCGGLCPEKPEGEARWVVGVVLCAAPSVAPRQRSLFSLPVLLLQKDATLLTQATLEDGLEEEAWRRHTGTAARSVLPV